MGPLKDRYENYLKSQGQRKAKKYFTSHTLCVLLGRINFDKKCETT